MVKRLEYQRLILNSLMISLLQKSRFLYFSQFFIIKILAKYFNANG
jgi:hypothetical protein